MTVRSPKALSTELRDQVTSSSFLSLVLSDRREVFGLVQMSFERQGLRTVQPESHLLSHPLSAAIFRVLQCLPPSLTPIGTDTTQAQRHIPLERRAQTPHTLCPGRKGRPPSARSKCMAQPERPNKSELLSHPSFPSRLSSQHPDHAETW